jgi:hypothetical protein
VLGPFQVLKPPLTLRPKQPPRTGPVLAAPVAWWKFDEESGETAANAAGPLLAGRLEGDPRWAPDQGRHQGSIELDGVDDWIECTDSTDLGIRENLSVSVWIKPRMTPPGGDTLLAKGEAWGLQRLGDTGELEFTLTGPQPGGPAKRDAPRVVCKRTLADDQWHHVVAVYDGKRMALYVDGAEVDSMNASGLIALNNLPLALGDNAANRGHRWNGWLDDARLYDRGLTVEEIKTLHQGPL